jgi:hypothetical protein
MPTLFRFLVFILFLGGIAVGSMFALTIFVEPTPREMTERIPARDLFGS